MTENQQSAIINLKFQVTPAGKFEIIAISQGKANGFVFSAEVLKESLSLWNGANVFVDHDGTTARKLTQLAGVISDPAWDDVEQGIRAMLTTAGPAGEVSNELGRVLLSGEIPDLNVGFSADIFLRYIEGNIVTRITKVNSLDVVYNPARGGKFLRVLNQKEDLMVDNVSTPKASDLLAPSPAAPVNPPTTTAHAWSNSELEAARTLLLQQGNRSQQAEEFRQQQEFRRQMCALLLEQGVSSSRLPQPAQEYVRAQFTETDEAGQKRVKVFNPSDLSAAIDQIRNLSGFLSANNIAGPAGGVISGMFTTEEQLQCAVDDLLGAPRDEKLKTFKPHRLHGIRELYLMLTGDDDMKGAYDPIRVRLQHTTATFTGLVKNALNKALVERWNALGVAGWDWWKNIATVEHFTSLNGITWIIFGTVSSLPAVSEGAEYAELQVGDSPDTSSFIKYGGFVGITLEALDRDDHRKLAAVPKELANAGIRNISALCTALFSGTAGAGPLLADGGRLFNATAVTTAGGHANLLTTALSSAQWETVSAAMYNQPMLVKNATGYYGVGQKMALNPSICLVPRALQLTAQQVFMQPWSTTTTFFFHTTQEGIAKVVTVPDWTDANDWAAAIDPMLVPGVMIGERFGLVPEIFISGDETSPAVFMNDESRIKVRHFIAVGVADWRPLANNHV